MSYIPAKPKAPPAPAPAEDHEGRPSYDRTWFTVEEVRAGFLVLEEEEN